MKFWGLLLFMTLLFALPAQAAQAPTLNQRVTRLEAHVRLLNAQADADRAQVAQLQDQVSRIEQALSKEIDRGTCQYAINRDTEAGLFHSLGLAVQAITGNPPPPDLQRVDDQGACQRIGVSR